ncbi:helix-turn-helix domain-containing protein [Fluoribacter dumoffii]|uniref:helix-turn-helix domain-containing protein n=1 Tax=Fluoribacter dumoffii TaxID=463 RepID=UPI0022446B1E|nr:helix-turn-helix transcriptional regulator [Fluoribacter dumoffii]MCW8416907.1 helix-turn-helix domain-containing protein [Fluoribacter dumoffii]MCW8455253.1 helix-turn-helix domain-containing protein [Fluoribacter dumoffii]MCW8460670.1 helix-turn-helix domain-containing protein [Fluoribacter dumoffii]MCW8484150.1 helix-turn-helix domain-containing protein [Fluoribacter dumoffii]
MNISARKHLEKLVGRMTLGKAIRSIRQAEAESQILFAKRLGVSKQYLCDLEHNRKIVSAKKAKQFAEILEYSIEQFIALAIQDSLEHDGIHMSVEVKAA